MWSDTEAERPPSAARERGIVDQRPPGPIRWERHAKPGGGERWIARLRPRDDRTYRRLVAPLVPAIERSLGPDAFANRAIAGARLRPWAPARDAWWRVARTAATDRAEGIVIVRSDVRDCYGSMGERALRAIRIGPELDGFLRALGDTGVRGLPVGPDPSAILANAILAAADHEAGAAGCRAIRWVDDVLLVAAGRRSAQRGFDAWRRALADLGLEAHDGKTRWFTGRGCGALPVGSGSGPGSGGRDIIAAP
jgi:hypothetical protein